MDFIRLWQEGSKQRANLSRLADELTQASAKGFRYFVADLRPFRDKDYAYTTILCDDGAGYMQVLHQELYMATLEAKKDCSFEILVNSYFSNPDCPDIKYNYSLF